MPDRSCCRLQHHCLRHGNRDIHSRQSRLRAAGILCLLSVCEISQSVWDVGHCISSETAEWIWLKFFTETEVCAGHCVSPQGRRKYGPTRAHSTVVLPLVYCPVDDTLFEVSPEIRFPVCQVATVLMKTIQLVLSPFKTFYRIYQK